MKKTFWLLACFGIFYACACKEKPVEPVFQNTVSCKVNGVDWAPNGPDGFLGFDKTLSYFFAPGETGLGIQALNREANQVLTFACYCKAEVGDYPMRNFSFRNDKTRCTYAKYTSFGRVSITNIDTVKRILSGTFDTKNPVKGDCNDSLMITDGKFELKY